MAYVSYIGLQQDKMLNKNVADYTNFEGKTNKKIVQAPGGASSFSLAWSTQKTDYGPERNRVKAKYSADQLHNQVSNNSKHTIDQSYSYKQPNNMGYDGQNVGGQQGYKGYDSYASGSYGGLGYANHNDGGAYAGGYKGYQAHNVLGSYGQYNGSAGYGGSGGYGSGIYGSGSGGYGSGSYGSGLSKPSSYNNDNYINQQINSINYGIRGIGGLKSESSPHQSQGAYKNHNNSYGSYGSQILSPTNQNLGQIRHASQANYSPHYGGYQGYNPQVQQLDIAVKQYNKPKSVSAYEGSEYNYRPSVKILGPPPQQFMIGDPSYNYWKQNEKETYRQGQPQQRKSKSQYQHQQRTSVKVSNPPGGKQTLRFG